MVSAFFLITSPCCGGVVNGGFETGDFTGWVADPCWVIRSDPAVHYSGWRGRCWAWTGGLGEEATGTLRSKPFLLDREAVRLRIAGWSSVRGTGKPRRWNYVALKLTDGTEIDRVWAPDTTAFVQAYLDAGEHRGRMAYIEAVDDADEPAFSMLGIDDVATADYPPDYRLPAVRPPRLDRSKNIVLEDDRYLVAASRDNGVVTRIRDKRAGLDLISEPRLADNFRFALPIPGREPWQTIEANWVRGSEQTMSSYSVDGDTMTLRWGPPLKNYLGVHYQCSVEMTVRLIPEGVLFGMRIDNRTRYPVGETYFPLLGGMRGLGTTTLHQKTTRFVHPTGDGTSGSKDIFRVFTNASWLGDQGPEQFYAPGEALYEPWVEFNSPKAGRSAFIGVDDAMGRALIARLELIPSNSATMREDGNWPRPDELKGIPCGVSFSFVDTEGTAAGSPYIASPVLVRFHGADPVEGHEFHRRRMRARGGAPQAED